MKALIIICLFTATAFSVQAQPTANPPGRPVGLISKDLGITPEQFNECFSGVRPAPRGERTDDARVHANKDVLLSCLKKHNPSITNSSLDTVMDRYRPGGREGGQPQF